MNKKLIYKSNSSFYQDKRDIYISLPDTPVKMREYRERTWKSQIFRTVKSSAKKRNIEFLLTEEDIPDPNEAMCPCFKVPLAMGFKKNFWNSASLDRIDNSKGYTKDNIWLVSSLFNRIKNDADHTLIKMIGKAVKSVECSGVTTPFHPDESQKIIIERLMSSRMKANSNNREFNIKWTDLYIPNFCPCTGRKIILDGKRDSKNWRDFPTIDRIDNSRGYVPGNVWIISAQANAVKSSATGDQILQVADTLEAKMYLMGK